MRFLALMTFKVSIFMVYGMAIPVVQTSERDLQKWYNMGFRHNDVSDVNDFMRKMRKSISKYKNSRENRGWRTRTGRLHRQFTGKEVIYKPVTKGRHF